jgi:hypothetical protein
VNAEPLNLSNSQFPNNNPKPLRKYHIEKIFRNTRPDDRGRVKESLKKKPKSGDKWDWLAGSGEGMSHYRENTRSERIENLFLHPGWGTEGG